jgi:hypothetical protein
MVLMAEHGSVNDFGLPKLVWAQPSRLCIVSRSEKKEGEVLMKKSVFVFGLFALLAASAHAEIRHANIKVFGMD